MSEKNAKIQAERYLDIYNDVYPQIIKEFEEIEDRYASDKSEAYVERFLEKINKTLRTLKNIDISSLDEIVTEEVIKVINHNIDYMYEELLNIKKRLEANDYVENLKSPVRRYIRQMKEDPSNYKKWAKDEEQLVNKFIGALTNPDNFDMYKNHIKRMALGTMSLKEFKKIFDAAKHKMIPLPSYAFESFREYTK